jgi:hypothetical protein
MSKLLKTLIGLCATFILQGCAREHLEINFEPVTATFVATITPQTLTRAEDTSWDANDQIGITTTSHSVTYSNVAHTTVEADGRFEVVDTTKAIMYLSDEEVEFTAYYPWTAGVVSTLAFSTANQAEQKSFDFLYGTGTGSSLHPEVELSFRHVMSKVVFSLKAGDDVTVAQLQAAKIQMMGLAQSGTFNVLTGETTLSSVNYVGEAVAVSETAPTTVSADGTSVQYTLIFPPQQLDEPITLVFNIDGVIFTAELTLPDENTLLDGTQYNLSVTLHKTSAVVEECSIAPWEHKSLNDLTAETGTK